MKKSIHILLYTGAFVAATLFGVSCAKETQQENEKSGKDNEELYEEIDTAQVLMSPVGITFVCSLPKDESENASDDTKVTIEGDAVTAASRLSWEKDDEITIRYKNTNYKYKAMTAGKTNVSFTPSDTTHYIAESVTLDYDTPLYFYYNVTVPEDGTSEINASFTIAADQTEGNANNKMPLTGYLAHPSNAYRDGAVHFKMKPSAQALQLRILQALATANSSGAAIANKLSLTSFAATGYLSGAFTVNPASGEVTSPSGTANTTQTMTLTFNGARKFTSATSTDTTQDIYIIVGPATVGEMRAKLLDAGNNICFWHSFYLSKTVNLEGKHTFTILPNGISNGPDLFYACEHSQNSGTWALFCSGEKDVDDKPVVYFTADIDAYTASHKDLYWDSLTYGNNACNYNSSRKTWSTKDAFWKDGGFLTTYEGSSVINWNPYDNNARRYRLVEGSINGKCPLGKYSGSCSNVKFYSKREGANCAMLADMTNSTARNLGFSGKINHQCPNARSYVASLSASAYGVCKFYCITNNMTISVTSVGDQVDSMSYHTAGGIVSSIRDIDNVFVAADAYFEDCVNTGALTVNAREYARVGGVAGYSTNASNNTGTVSFKGCKNSGSLSVTSGMTAVAGGMISQVYHFPSAASDGMTATSCTNEGKITAVSNGTISGGCVYAGGILARFSNGNKLTLKGCKNTGNVSITNNGAYVCAGGLAGNLHPAHQVNDLGYVTLGGTTDADKNQNTGTISGSFTKTMEDDVYLGGIAGRVLSSSNIENCINSGNVYSNSTNTSLLMFQGGIVGEIGAHSTDEPPDTEGKEESVANDDEVNFNYTFKSCSNSGKIYTGSDANTADRLGGILGCASSNVKTCDIKSCTNSGEIASASPACFGVGGIIAQMGAFDEKRSTEKSTVSYCTNEAKITSKGTSNKCFVGGIAGFIRNQVDIKNCTCKGTSSTPIIIEGGSGDSQNTGGIVGLFDGGISGKTSSTCELNNCLSQYIKVSGGDYVGGVAGAVENNVKVVDCQLFNGSVTATGYLVGGIAGGIFTTEGKTGSFLFKHCRLSTETEVIGGSWGVGAILGGLNSSCRASSTLKMDNNYCQNSPFVKGLNSVGGMIGQIKTSDKTGIEINVQVYNTVIGSLVLECTADTDQNNPTFGGLIGEVHGYENATATIKLINNVVWSTSFYHHRDTKELDKVYLGGAIGYIRPESGYTLNIQGFSTSTKYDNLYTGNKGSATRSYSDVPPSRNPIGSTVGRAKSNNVSASYLYALYWNSPSDWSFGNFRDGYSPTYSDKYQYMSTLKDPATDTTNTSLMNIFRNGYGETNPSKDELKTWEYFDTNNHKAYINY